MRRILRKRIVELPSRRIAVATQTLEDFLYHLKVLFGWRNRLGNPLHHFPLNTITDAIVHESLKLFVALDKLLDYLLYRACDARRNPHKSA